MKRARPFLTWLMAAAAAAPLFNNVSCRIDEDGIDIRSDVDDDDDLEDFFDDLDDWLDDIFD